MFENSEHFEHRMIATTQVRNVTKVGTGAGARGGGLPVMSTLQLFAGPGFESQHLTGHLSSQFLGIQHPLLDSTDTRHTCSVMYRHTFKLYTHANFQKGGPGMYIYILP